MQRIVILIFALLTGIGASSQPTLKELFCNMPDSIMPLLTKNDRLDLCDFADSHMDAVVTNRLGGITTMPLISPGLICLRYTLTSNLYLKLFNSKKGPVVCLVHKYHSGDVQDCTVNFYNADWKKLDVHELIQLPTFADFLNKKELKSDSLQLFLSQSLIRPIVIDMYDSEPYLSFSYSGLDYLGEEKERFAKFVRTNPIHYKWNGRKFKRQNK